MPTLQIIGPDVSNVNSRGENGALLKSQQCSFLICKVGEGLLTSSNVHGFDQYGLDIFARINDAQAKSNGLLRGRYYFLHRGNGAAQAEHFVRLTKMLGDVALVGHLLDVEKQNPSYGPTYQDVVDFVNRWRELMPGYPLGIYSGSWYWKGVLGNPKMVGDFYWDSSYVNGSGNPWALLKQVTVGWWGKWGGVTLPVLRQFTSTADVGGISPSDCSVWWGSADDLQKMWAYAKPVIPVQPKSPLQEEDVFMFKKGSRIYGFFAGVVKWLNPTEYADAVHDNVPLYDQGIPDDVKQTLAAKSING